MGLADPPLRALMWLLGFRVLRGPGQLVRVCLPEWVPASVVANTVWRMNRDAQKLSWSAKGHTIIGRPKGVR